MKRRSAFLGATATGLMMLGAALHSAAQPTDEPTTVGCAHFPAEASSAHRAGVPPLSWRTDFPSDIQAVIHPWEAIDFRSEWQRYMAAVLSEIEAAGVAIQNNRLVMAPDAEWWIAPWMDYGSFGREARLGLTKERGPDPGDLSPASMS